MRYRPHDARGDGPRTCRTPIRPAAELAGLNSSIPVVNRPVLRPPGADGDAAGSAEGENAKPAAVEGTDNRFGIRVGELGVADSPLRPAGRVLFGDRFVDVVTDGSFVDKGCQIRVIDISGNRVVVRKVD